MIDMKTPSSEELPGEIQSCEPVKLNPLQVGRVKIDPPILLAPMASITTPSMRTICEEMGCSFTFTEMISVDGLVRRPEKLLRFVAPSFNRRLPYGVQFVGRNPEEMARAAVIAADSGVAVVDLNMGCPARKVTAGGNGAALMKTPALAGRIVDAVVGAVGDRVVVSVKIRTGWDEHSLNGPEIAKIAEKAGAGWITVHGRPRSRFCSGRVDLDEIARVVKSVDIPVLGNGGIIDRDTYETMVKKTGCSGVMVAQGALGNPWIFRELGEKGEKKPVSIEERRRVMSRHLDLYLREGGSAERAVREMRKHIGWYSKGVYGGASFRREVFKLTDPDQVRRHIEKLGCG